MNLVSFVRVTCYFLLVLGTTLYIKLHVPCSYSPLKVIVVAKQGNYWYHNYNVLDMTVLDWGLNPGPPALKASTLPLGYR